MKKIQFTINLILRDEIKKNQKIIKAKKQLKK